MLVSSVNKVAILKYYNELLANGSSDSIVETINKLLNKFFRYALSEGYIPRNPLTGLRLPKDNEEIIDEDEGIVDTFSDEELKLIINAAGDTKLKYVVMFAVLTGARIGEILALEKKDIKNGIVKINKSVRTVKVFIDETHYKNEIKVTTPKTKSSNREIPLNETLQKELKNLSKLVKEEKLKLGPAYTENTLLFPSLTGTYMDSSNIRTSWKRALSKSGIEYKKFHSLRHTYGTRMTENGVILLTVSRLMGHGSIKTTEIYAHTSQDTKIEAVKTLNSMFI